MSRRAKRYIVPLAGIAAVALAALGPARWPARAEGAPAGGYVGSAVCAGCHPQVAQAFTSTAHGKALSDAARPESQRACEACHGPGEKHVGSGGKLPPSNPEKQTAAEVEALCGGCHFGAALAGATSVTEGTWKRSPHGRNEKSCLACHRMHGAGAAAQTCATCHSALTKAPAGGVVHGPVKQGQCLLCHDPHGNGAAHSVKPTLGAVCESCHTPTAALTKAHSGYDVAGSDCTRCHDPHSTDAGRAYLRTVSHPPFAQGNCQVCHAAPPVTARKKADADVCFTCHPKSTLLPEKDAQDRPMRAHAPAAAGLCTACHEPHVADAGSPLLKGAPGDTCVACHRSVGVARNALHAHPPAAKGACLTCHAGHGSAEPALLHKEEAALCQTCHQEQAQHAHPIGPNVKDPTTGKPVMCASCHAVHGSEFPYIMPQQETAMCLSCHTPSDHDT